MRQMITAHLLEGPPFGRSMNGGLGGRSRRRRLRESSEQWDEARQHLCDAIAVHHANGDHSEARRLAAQLAKWDSADDDEEDLEEDDESQSQAGRGKPAKGKGETNTDGDAKGKESME